MLRTNLQESEVEQQYRKVEERTKTMILVDEEREEVQSTGNITAGEEATTTTDVVETMKYTIVAPFSFKRRAFCCALAR